MMKIFYISNFKNENILLQYPCLVGRCLITQPTHNPHTTNKNPFQLLTVLTLLDSLFPQPTTLTNQKHPTIPTTHTTKKHTPQKNTQKKYFFIFKLFLFF